MYWYDKLLSPLMGRWVMRFALPGRPLWLHRLVVNHLRRWEQERVSTPFLAAQAAGVGIATQFWPAGTSKEVILRWYDEQVVNTPAIPETGLDYFKMLLLRCTPAEAAQAASTGTTLPLDHLLVQWTGKRPDWWTHARHQFADALPPDHQGLYTVANGAAIALLAVLDRPR